MLPETLVVGVVLAVTGQTRERLVVARALKPIV